METVLSDQSMAALRSQAARLAEVKEQVAEGIDLLTDLPDADTVLQHFVQIYGSLSFIHQDIVALLPTDTGAAISVVASACAGDSWKENTP